MMKPITIKDLAGVKFTTRVFEKPKPKPDLAKQSLKSMRKLLTILFLWAGQATGQPAIHTIIDVYHNSSVVTIDTFPQIITVMDGAHEWEYRHKDGKLLYRIAGYEPELTPKGGYMIKVYTKPTIIGYNGFTVIKTTITGTVKSTEVLAYLGRDKKPLDKKYLIMWPYNIPVDGYK